MNKLMACGYCCALLSVWAVIQLTLLGIFFKVEAVPLIHDAEAHESEDVEDYIAKTKDNYAKIAINCWLSAVVYAITLLLSIGCIMSAKKKAAKAGLTDTEDAVCEAMKKQKKKKK